MATQLGNIIKNYAKKFNIIVTDETGDNLTSGTSYVVPNSLVITSPSDKCKFDIGTPSLFASDVNGDVVRLTYTMAPGKGLVINNSNHDVMQMAIDEYSITAGNSDELNVNLRNIIDNHTINVVTPGEQTTVTSSDVETINTGNKLKVIADNLDTATNVSYGVVKIGNNTLNNDNGIISVNTQNLDYVDDDSDISGILRHDNINPEVSFKNGYISVHSQYLDPATSTTLGVVMPDNAYTFVENGVLKVKNFTYATTDVVWDPSGEIGVDHADYKSTIYTRGIVAPDNKTLTTNDGIMSVITTGLAPAKHDEYTSSGELGVSGCLGVVKPDGISLHSNVNGVLRVQRYGELITMLDTLDNKFNAVWNKIYELDARIRELETPTVIDKINLITNDNNSIEKIVKPVWDDINKQISNNEQYVKFTLNLSTNCAFKVSILFASNVAPAITVHKLKVGNETPVVEQIAQTAFSNTNNEITTIELTLACKNFYSTNIRNAYTNTDVIVKITSINDESISASALFNVKRYNAKLYEYEQTIFNFKEFERIQLIAEWSTSSDLEWLGYSSNQYKINTLTDTGKSFTKNIKLRVKAINSINEFSPVNKPIADKINVINSNLNLFNIASEEIKSTPAQRKKYARQEYTAFNSGVSLAADDALDKLIFANAKLAYTNPSFNTDLISNEQIKAIAVVNTIADMKNITNYYTEIKTPASVNVLACVDGINNEILSSYKVAKVNDKTTYKYVPITLVSSFPSNYKTKLASDPNYAGYMKVTYISSYTYPRLNGSAKTYETTNINTPFITIKTNGMDNDGFTALQVSTNTPMSKNMSSRDCNITLTSYNGLQKTIIYHEDRKEAVNSVVSLTTTLNNNSPWATVTANKSEDLIPIFKSANNNDYSWYIKFTYSFIDKNGYKVNINNVTDFSGQLSFNNLNPNQASTNLNFTLPKNKGVRALKINPESITIPQLQGITYKLQNYSRGCWNILDPDYYKRYSFNDAFVQQVSICRSTTAVKSNKWITINAKIVAGGKTNIPNGSIIKLASPKKYNNPEIYIQYTGGYHASSHYDYYTLSATPWNNGTTITLTFKNQTGNVAPTLFKYFAFNFELIACDSNDNIITKDIFTPAKTSVTSQFGQSKSKDYTTEKWYDCNNLINADYDTTNTNKGTSAIILSNQAQIVNQLETVTNTFEDLVLVAANNNKSADEEIARIASQFNSNISNMYIDPAIFTV